jgi:uncharacterized repeat protein (TIGR02543 family)
MMIGGIVGVITLLIIMTIAGRSDRQMEICNVLPSVVETTLVDYCLDDGTDGMSYGAIYDVDDDNAGRMAVEGGADEADEADEMSDDNKILATVAGNLAILLDSEAALRLSIYGEDTDKGLLSICATEEYKQPNGTYATVSCSRTAIIDRKCDIDAKDASLTCSVSFYVGDELYKVFRIHEGDVMSSPAQPQGHGYIFAGWEDDNGYLADFTQPVTQDRNYYATWR